MPSRRLGERSQGVRGLPVVTERTVIPSRTHEEDVTVHLIERGDWPMLDGKILDENTRKRYVQLFGDPPEGMPIAEQSAFIAGYMYALNPPVGGTACGVEVRICPHCQKTHEVRFCKPL